MKCEKCGNKLTLQSKTHRYVESGLDNVFLQNCRILTCESCVYDMPLLPSADKLLSAVCRVLLLQPTHLTGRQVAFLRNALELRSIELAEILGTTRVEVSRWENDKAVINGLADLKLRLEAVDRIIRGLDHRSMRDQVTMMMQRAYNPKLPSEDIVINAAPLYATNRKTAKKQEVSVPEYAGATS